MLATSFILYGPDNTAKENFITTFCEKLDGHIIHRFGEEKGLGIGEIQTIRNNASLRAGDKTQVFVIHRADYMTPEAYQALLKTLEEPPQKTSFFLITSSLAIPETILSRLTKLPFWGDEHTIEEGEMIDFFHNETIRLKHELENAIIQTQSIPQKIFHEIKQCIKCSLLASHTRISERNIKDLYTIIK